ncbi:MAG: signal recognition particle-docking protein FtsY [Alphaproteobacteria bacterium]|nr:signal recognition particle-docking protein FtsY [Alphaproteobacteria bacterium]
MQGKEADKQESSSPIQKKGWIRRLSDGLSHSSGTIRKHAFSLFTKRKLDESLLENLEMVLLKADFGVGNTISIIQSLRNEYNGKDVSPEKIAGTLAREVERILLPVAHPLNIANTHHPHIIFLVGVNGSGKTTTIGKLATQFRKEGKKVMLAACDTFRAGAIDQLKIWAERSGTEFIARAPGADPAGLLFDAISQARKEGMNILLVDTAGRLQNRQDLMAELQKLVRVAQKQDQTAPHDIIIVLDATTGQNALQQVEVFKKTAGVTGIIMTKLDGTAKGGILLAIADQYALPIHAIGIGEGINDLQPFTAHEFAQAIAGQREREQSQ